MLVVTEADGAIVEERLLRVFSTVTPTPANLAYEGGVSSSRAALCMRCTCRRASTHLRCAQSELFIDKSQTSLQAIAAMTFVCDGCEEKAGQVTEDEEEDEVAGKSVAERPLAQVAIDFLRTRLSCPPGTLAANRHRVADVYPPV